MESLVTIKNIESEISLILHLVTDIKQKNFQVQGLKQAENTLAKLKDFNVTDENKDELYNRLSKMYQNLYSNYMQVCQAEKSRDTRRMDYFENS